MAAIFQCTAHAILTFDANGSLTMLNPAGEKLFSNEGIKLGLPLTRGCGYDALKDLLDEACISKKAQTKEIVWPDERVFTAMITPIEADGYAAILHDITHFKESERVKNEFVSTASHDLKNPISVITGFTDLLSHAGPLNQKQIEYTHRIQAAAENMDGLVRWLLQLTKQDMRPELNKETVELNDLLSEITDEFQPQARAKQQSLLFEEPKDKPRVAAEPFQLRQALRNLVGNAIKFTPTGGSITLSLETRQDAVAINVKDTGCGIPPNELPLIFNRFHRVGNEALKGIEGNGLGLAIAKSIIEQHNGRLSVESELSKGSCFTFTLPFV